jgi:hypothetical protein
VTDPDSRRIVAVHECGHVLTNRILGHPVAGVTIIERNGLAGLCWSPDADPAALTSEYVCAEAADVCSNAPVLRPGEPSDELCAWFGVLRERVLFCLSGLAAERVLFGREYSRAIADTRCARTYARALVLDEAALEAFLTYSNLEVELLLRRFRRSLEELTRTLLERKTLSAEEIDEGIRRGVAGDQHQAELEQRARASRR